MDEPRTQGAVAPTGLAKSVFLTVYSRDGQLPIVHVQRTATDISALRNVEQILLYVVPSGSPF
jgi:hypothetical protein